MQGSSRTQEEPFPSEDDCNVINILVSDKDVDLLERGATSIRSLFQTLQEDEKASINESGMIHWEIKAKTLSLPGYRLLDVESRGGFSRRRNFKAEDWRERSVQKADAYVYHVEIKNLGDYLSNKNNWYSEPAWETDRKDVSRFLRKSHLVGNPQKPLVLLVNYQGQDGGDEGEAFDVGRLVHLFGLDFLARPFRALSYSGIDELKEILKWTSNVVRQATGDEATAVTEPESEDEISIATGYTAVSAADTYVLDYEPTLPGGNATLQRFEPIKSGTPCPFARAAKLWGGKLPDETLNNELTGRFCPMKAAASLNAGPLAEFVARVSEGEPLDGFCLEIESSWRGVDFLGQSVRKLLTELGRLDPTPGENAMKTMGPVDSPRWRFRFAGEDFFLTTFSSAYNENSSRYSFRTNEAFLLLQPLTSFGRHGLDHDTPASATKWENPTSMRDKARAAFKEAGCPYYIPEELPYPVAEHIVKPENDDGTNFIRWWEKPKLEEHDEDSSVEN